MLFWKRMAWSRWTGRLNRKAGSESDYKMNLLEVRDSGKYIFNNADVQSVFEITRETFAGHFDAIREKYGDKELGAELLTMIGQMTGSKKLVSMGINKEADNMCTALEKLIEDGKKEGMQEGRLTSVKNLMGEYGMEGRAGDGCIENLTRRQE